MTDAEMVERVAREVLGITNIAYRNNDFSLLYVSKEGFNEVFDPITDANDLMMVLEKFDDWQIRFRKGLYDFTLFNNFGVYGATRSTLAHAVLEAAIKAVEK